ncbi:anther-specific protein BCP1-like [Abeliophyllum distichum]|uniref:Anther-specific protein BCP1-like n=1 Tax=Abeliophyllum distichum TaxID=126358 RepID=A0ABD1U4G3_9LAMI
MARQIIVLALVFFAVVGMASAAGDHKDAHAEGAAAPKASDGVIGTTSGATPRCSTCRRTCFGWIFPQPCSRTLSHRHQMRNHHLRRSFRGRCRCWFFLLLK